MLVMAQDEVMSVFNARKVMCLSIEGLESMRKGPKGSSDCGESRPTNDCKANDRD